MTDARLAALVAAGCTVVSLAGLYLALAGSVAGYIMGNLLAGPGAYGAALYWTAAVKCWRQARRAR